MNEQVKVEKLQVRPEDFRRAWPNALALAIAEAGALVAECATVKDKLDDTGEKVVKMAQLTNRHVALVQETLKETMSQLMVHHVGLVQSQTNQILEQLTEQTTILIGKVAKIERDLEFYQADFLRMVNDGQDDLKKSMVLVHEVALQNQKAQEVLQLAAKVSQELMQQKKKGFFASLFS